MIRHLNYIFDFYLYIHVYTHYIDIYAHIYIYIYIEYIEYIHAEGPGAARRGATAAAMGPGATRRRAWDARTVRATAAAVGPGDARRGAWGARTVRATAAAVGPGAARGAWGGHGLGEGGDVLNVIKEESLKYKEKTKMREIPQNQGLTCDLQCIFTFLPKTQNYPMVDTHILVVGFRPKQR